MGNVSDRLLKNYRETCYSVSFADGTVGLLFVGQSHPDLDAHFVGAEWTIVTAFNPYSQTQTDAVNESSQRQLRAELAASKSLKCWDATGVLGEWREESVLVVGLDLQAAFELGKRYRQNAIVFGRAGDIARLIDCTGKAPRDVTN